MRVFVTGATGFVGHHAVVALRAAGHDVRCLVRRPAAAAEIAALGAEVVPGGLSDVSVLASAVDGCDTVLHVAGAIVARSFDEMRDVNEGGTARLVTACRRAPRPPRRFVLVSSLAAAGPSVPGRPVREDDPPQPVSRYGTTKLLGERAAVAAAPADLELVIVRPPAVFGPRDRGILAFFQAAAAGVRPHVGSRSGAESRRISIVYGPDLARALVLALASDAAAGRTYHVGYDEHFAIEGVIDEIAAAVGRRGLAVRTPDAIVRGLAVVAEECSRVFGGVPQFSRDKAAEFLAPGWMTATARIRDELGWRPAVPFRHALRDTAQWYREAGWIPAAQGGGG